MTSRMTAILLLSGLLVAPIAGMASEEEPQVSHGTGGNVSAHEEKPHTGALQQATIYLKEYHFEPALTTFEAGKPAQLTLVNNGKVVHEFITKALLDQAVDMETRGVVAETTGLEEIEIPPGGKVVLRFTPEKAGEFPIACHATNPVDHFQKGMSGKLVIK